MDIVIKNGYLLGPAGGAKRDILIKNGKIARIAERISLKATSALQAEGMYVLPGLIDMHCHLREPGREDKETLLSGSLAAVAGGFTTICCMPNTTPALDSKVSIGFVRDRARQARCEVLPIGSITCNREGKALPSYGEMIEEGAVAFSDDGSCVMNSLVMRRALEYSRFYDKPVISHSEDMNLSSNGLMNEGPLSTKMGLTGIPRQAEIIMVDRDISLASLTGGRLHLAHLSVAESVEAVRRAKKHCGNVTCEVAVHHLILTEEDVAGYNTNAKMLPPLRTARDVRALIAALKDGTVDCLVTDHAPHTEEEKESGFEAAPFGIIGLETALSLAMELVSKSLPPELIAELFTGGPAGVLGIERGALAPGTRADIAVFDPKREWIYRKEDIVSKSKNSPFIGRRMKGRVMATICRGKMAFNIM